MGKALYLTELEMSFKYLERACQEIIKHGKLPPGIYQKTLAELHLTCDALERLKPSRLAMLYLAQGVIKETLDKGLEGAGNNGGRIG